MILFWAFIAVASILLYRYLNKKRNYFKDRGIPGPRPKVVVGNLPELFLNSAPLKLREWTKTYGATYGIVDGGANTIITTDLDVLHDVFVKKFDLFHGRKPFPVQPDPELDAKVHVVLARGQRWKRLRATAAPQFAVNRLRQLMPIMGSSCDAFMAKCAQIHKGGKPVDFYKLYQLFTMDAIAKLALDEQSEVSLIESADRPYVQWARQAFQVPDNPIIYCIVGLAAVFPALNSLVIKMLEMAVTNDTMQLLIDYIHRRVEKRKQQLEERGAMSHERHDFIHLFLDAEVDDAGDNEGLGYGSGSLANADVDKWRLAGSTVEKCLSMDEITMQCLVFLLAGYDTTANTLAYTTHLLATNPDKQAKLLEEVRSNVKSKDDITFDLVNNGLPYMEMVIKESLRMYPHASLVNARQCMHSCTIGSLPIEKGVNVWADTWTIHYDKAIWGDDADEFRPERFEAAEHNARHPMSYLAFGAGPRLCLGRRLAMVEMKMLLCYVLATYRFELCDQTQVPLKIFGAATMQPGFFVLCKVNGCLFKVHMMPTSP